MPGAIACNGVLPADGIAVRAIADRAAMGADMHRGRLPVVGQVQARRTENEASPTPLAKASSVVSSGEAGKHDLCSSAASPYGLFVAASVLSQPMAKPTLYKDI